MKKKYYIGERVNPQLNKPYYNAYGQLTKKEVAIKEDVVYGRMSLSPYDSISEYEAAKALIINTGYKLNIYE